MLALQPVNSADILSALPLGGKYDLLSALWGQSTTRGPNLRKLAVISSTKQRRNVSRREKNTANRTASNISFYFKMFFESCFLEHSLQKSNLLSEIPLLGGYIWLSTVNHAECVSNYNSLPFTFNKPDIKNLEEKNLTLAKVTALSRKKDTLKIGMFSVFVKKKKAKYTKYLKHISIYVK